ncbi:matrixin family metalloprotease [Paenarthrobacter sp. JL.01a]|uniref:matrixin family metalloprotease n=1 Tax=Paenarthrobacter sp. JL.01a TaxID=2979324 RepID=UPI0021CA2632|nr:matrixin family metalloprotease [Paenarthrobacter sp. JL.01a]UXM92763.1 peptidase M10A and M12B matrixin and adamalysin [Paenarthrobacter sp. JL.01a]
MEPYGSSKWPDPDPPRPRFLPPSPGPREPPEPRPPIKHSSVAVILFLLGILGLVCAGAFFGGELQQFLYGSSQTQSQPARPGFAPFGQRDDPLPGREEADAPLGAPPPVLQASSSYKFLAVKADGTPLAYSPCRPIHYVVNSDLAPASWQDLVEEAVQQASNATGLKFIYDGPSSEIPSPNRSGYQPARYGDRWAPVLIAWSTPEQVPRLTGQTVGLGGSSSIGLSNGYKAYVTGTVSLDAPQFAGIVDTPDGDEIGVAVIMHELGHLVGLDHVDDPRQLMYGQASWVRHYAAGDLTGLAKLGAGPCSKDF